MSQPVNAEYDELVATAYAVGIPSLSILSIIVLCCGTKLCCCLCTRVDLSRSRPRNLGGPNYPPDIGSVGQRRSSGEQPRIWDVSTASRFPPRSEPGPQSEKPGLGQGQGEDERHDVNRAADDGKGAEWTELLPLSADKVLDADTVVHSLRVNSKNPVRSTSSTRVQVSIIILMPAPPPAPPPNPVSYKIYDPPGEYVLGTSYIPYTQHK